jgi:hypothetical protein
MYETELCKRQLQLAYGGGSMFETAFYQSSLLGLETNNIRKQKGKPRVWMKKVGFQSQQLPKRTGNVFATRLRSFL